MQRPDWAPQDVDLDVPSPARVYDALLGGSHNFEVDRAAAAHGTALMPGLARGAMANRQFLRRAVAYLAEAGITQFLDVGAGIPTVGNTHEIAQATDPDNRVLYVDIDAVAVAHARSILAGNNHAAAIRADLRSPDELLAAIDRTGLIDFSRPVGLLLVAVIHLVPDEDGPDEAVAALRSALAPGSFVVISHLTSDGRPDESAQLSSAVARRDRVSLVFRPKPDIARFFGDFELVPPGLGELSRWGSGPGVDDGDAGGSSLYRAGVGRKG